MNKKRVLLKENMKALMERGREKKSPRIIIECFYVFYV